MRKVIIIALLSATLLVPGMSLAQLDNIIGITNSDYYLDNCLVGPEGQVYTVHLILVNPVNLDFGAGEVRAVENVGGFECKLTATGSASILAKRFPVPSIDVGQAGSLIVGFSEPVPVNAEGYAFLAEVDVLLAPDGDPLQAFSLVKASPVPCDSSTGFLYLNPAYPPSITGSLAYLDADDPDDQLVAATWMSPWDDYPSFMLEPSIVATDARTWDSVKAIYR